MENRFNLIDEPWIPVAGGGMIGLKQLFSDRSCPGLGGNPVQKIALTKLLLAIAQAANTPRDDREWAELGPDGLAESCLTYLENWHDRFFLYGSRPFLQMPGVERAGIKSYGIVLPEVAAGNTTVLTQSQSEKLLSDAERALLLVTLMGFALGGKQTDNSVVLSTGYQGKSNAKGNPSSGKPGPALAYKGLLHSFYIGDTEIETLWLNLITRATIDSLKVYPKGLGTPPWESMPSGEDCLVAQSLKASLMGRLVPMSRFCLLSGKGLHYSEGIAHLSYSEGMADPTVAINTSLKKPKVLWVDPEKRPWRLLTSLLSFLDQVSNRGYECHQLKLGLARAQQHLPSFGLWSGGLRVSSNAGEQYVTGSDDFVESWVVLDSKTLGSFWFARLNQEMDGLDRLSRTIQSAVLAYYEYFEPNKNSKKKKKDHKARAKMADSLFWQLCERRFQDLVNSCALGEEDQSKRNELHRKFVGYAHQAYNGQCPSRTARQIDAWAQSRPNPARYFKEVE